MRTAARTILILDREALPRLGFVFDRVVLTLGGTQFGGRSPFWSGVHDRPNSQDREIYIRIRSRQVMVA
jgi:hypothetical protein